MPFVQAKCPECGGMLAVDDSKKAAMCQFCGEAFIVQEAINNYNTYNITNNNTNHNYGDGAVVNVYENQNSVSALMERAFMFLKDGDFARANEYFEKVLDVVPKCSEAYLGKLMVDLKVKKESALYACDVDFGSNKNFQNIMSYGDKSIKNKVEEMLTKTKHRISKVETEKRRKEVEEAIARKEAEQERIERLKNLKQKREQAKMDEEQRKAKENAEREAKIQAEKAEKQRIIAERKRNGLCQHCGGELKGFLGKKCVKCGKPKDY